MPDRSGPAPTARPVSRYPVPDLASMPDDIRQRIEGVFEKAGFVPNVFVALAHRPDEFRAFFAYHDALMEKQSGTLSKGDRELIVVAVSAIADCHYCVVAHGALARIHEKKPFIADQVAINWRRADLAPRQRAMLSFAVKVAERSGEIADDDFAALHGHGFDAEDAWDIAAIAAFFGMSNRLANTFAIRPNDEFYLMGRIPREKKGA